MPGLVPGIHVFLSAKKDVDGLDIGEREATPSFERLSPAMTKRPVDRNAWSP
jgi:hypothetical protein